MKKNILIILICSIVFTIVGVYAATTYLASEIAYKDTTVESALDELYNLTPKKFCELKSGSEYAIGSKYECDPGDGVKRNFYVLEVRNNELDLIMETNLSDTVGTARTMTWNDAMKYFRTGAGVSIKNAWTNIMEIDLPKAQAITDAVDNLNYIIADADVTWWCFGSKTSDSQSSPHCTNANQGNYAWLFNYLIGCRQAGCTTESGAKANGYWTRELVSNTVNAHAVFWPGALGSREVSYSAEYGVRPVITVLKNNLYSNN